MIRRNSTPVPFPSVCGRVMLPVVIVASVIVVGTIILPRYANKLTWFRLSTKQIVGFLIGSVSKPCIVRAPTTVKLPHASGHSSGNRQGHMTKKNTHRFEIFVASWFTNVWFLLYSWHHWYIFSYYHSSNDILSLARGLLIVTSHTSCDVTVPSSCVVTQTPIGTNSGTRRRKRKFPLPFVKLWSW